MSNVSVLDGIVYPIVDLLDERHPVSPDLRAEVVVLEDPDRLCGARVRLRVALTAAGVAGDRDVDVGGHARHRRGVEIDGQRAAADVRGGVARDGRDRPRLLPEIELERLRRQRHREIEHIAARRNAQQRHEHALALVSPRPPSSPPPQPRRSPRPAENLRVEPPARDPLTRRFSVAGRRRGSGRRRSGRRPPGSGRPLPGAGWRRR